MEYGICNISVVPVRREPSDRSEMVSQLLFGETFSITEIMLKWVNIRIDHDNYEGWIDKKQFLALDESNYLKINLQKTHLSIDITSTLNVLTQNNSFPILPGSSLPGLAEDDTFSLLNNRYKYQGNSIEMPLLSLREKSVELATLYLNAPYLWGGRSPFGIDCSGFTQMVYKLVGTKLKRDASQQATQGETISFINEALPGDLAFFDDEEGNIIHTGILLGSNQIIHASGQVRIDTIDHHGIYNRETKAYTHNLRIIKQLLG